jgi:hypothetical protein
MAKNLPARRGLAATRQATAVWSPLAEMGELYARMSRLMHAAWGGGRHWSGQAWAPLADLRETDDAYVVEIDDPPPPHVFAEPSSCLMEACRPCAPRASTGSAGGGSPGPSRRW